MSRARRLAAGVALHAALLGGCGGPALLLDERGSAEQAVAAAVAGLPSAGAYATTVLDFSAARVEGGALRAGPARLRGRDGGGFTLVDSAACSPSGPASCATLGSRAYLELHGAGEVRFDEPQVVLGLHLSLQGSQVPALDKLRPTQGASFVFQLPTFRVLVSGLDADGQVTDTLRAIPATATFAATRVEQGWLWVDASLLGPVSGLRLAVESPIPGLETILVDNLALSPDFRADDHFFTIALLPDTQKYAERADLFPLFTAQTRFLADRVDAEHLVFVSGLGDIVEHGDNLDEWARADQAISLLDGKVPYGAVVGNHDYQDQWDHPELGSPNFLAHFPARRYQGQPWWLGPSPDGLGGAQRFDTPAGPLLYLHLPVDAVPPTVAWARSVLADHPGVPALVSTHAYLREDGRLPVPYLTSLTPGAWQGISANELFSTLVAPNPQIVIVTCGHVSAENYQASANLAGQPVHELLQDYQNREQGGEGFLRLLRFYPAPRAEVRVITYSPGLRTFEVDADSLFAFPLDLAARRG